jgi:DNA-binding transcriptional regulator YbjK
VVAAIEVVAQEHLDRARAAVDELGPAAPDVAAACLVRLVLPDDVQPAALSGFYERYLQAGREPALRPAVVSWNDRLRGVVGEAIERLGCDGDPALVLAVVDGLAVTALAEGVDDVPAAVACGLTGLLRRGPA